jgi:hypothetical protein
MGNSADAMRRWLGAFCLAVAFGLLVWGETVLKPILTGLTFLLYWGGCFLFTTGAIIFALLDIRAVRRRVQEDRRELVERTFQDLKKKTDPIEH